MKELVYLGIIETVIILLEKEINYCEIKEFMVDESILRFMEVNKIEPIWKTDLQ